MYVFRKVTQPAGRGGGAGQAGSCPQQERAPPQGGNIVWTEVARLAAPAGGRGDRFGSSLAAADREVWVGAPGAAGAGRVFVFSGNAAGFQIDGLRLLGPEWTDPIAAGIVDLDPRQRGGRRRHGRESRRRRPPYLRARRVRRLARAADDDHAARRASGDHRRRAPLRQHRQDRGVRLRRRGSAVLPAAVED